VYMSSLGNKTLILTGGSLGIGKALALVLAEEGVKLVLNARHEEPLKETCAACRELGVDARYVAGNLASDSVATELVARAMDMGDFYGFIHGAGVLHPGPLLWELEEEHFQEVFDASVAGAYQLMRLAIPPLRKQGEGLAVFLGSGAAEITMPGMAAYCAAKAAEEHMGRQLAAEAPEIVTINYRPGIVDTRMQAQGREAEGDGARALRETFQTWRETGQLLTPEQSARWLVEKVLKDNPARFHGRTIRAMEEGL
jgi:NAD(P)-dependent dehydrogenase (short-subunit alcohol dehydrogenase family)